MDGLKECPMNIEDDYPAQLIVLHGPGTAYLKSTVDMKRYMRAEIDNYAKGKTKKIEKVMNLEDVQVSFS